MIVPETQVKIRARLPNGQLWESRVAMDSVPKSHQALIIFGYRCPIDRVEGSDTVYLRGTDHVSDKIISHWEPVGRPTYAVYGSSPRHRDYSIAPILLTNSRAAAEKKILELIGAELGWVNSFRAMLGWPVRHPGYWVVKL